MDWIPIKTRPQTEEEKESYGDYDYMFDCPLPEEGVEVLVTLNSGEVAVDTFVRDGYGSYFEDYYEDGEVIAWMPFPDGYKRQEE